METAKPDYKDIDEYIACFPPDVQTILQKVRQTVHAAAPDAQEAIKYQMPTFVQNGSLVHFSALKRGIGFYPTPSGVDHFASETAAYKQTKSALQFPYDQPIPYELIAKITAFRLQENLAKARKK